MMPKKLEEVKKNLSQKVVYYTVKHDKPFLEKVNTLAFVYKQEGEYAGKTYSINIDSTVDENSELYAYLFMHEAGHIIFNHVSGNNVLSDKFLDSKVESIIQACANKHSELSREDVKYGIKSTLLNQITDWEVNTKLFSEDEQKDMENQTSTFLGTKIKIALPQYFDYPLGKTANEYLIYIMSDIEKWLDKMKDSLKDGNGGKGNSRQGSSSDGMKELAKAFAKSGKQQKANEKEKGELNSQGKDKSSSGSERKELEATECNNMEMLKKEIKKFLVGKDDFLNKRNPIYYYNRNKYNSNVMHVKEQRESVFREKPMTVLLDVSGSIEESLASGFTKIFKEISKEIGQKCRIIFWSDTLLGDFSSKDNFNPLYGGGTEIGDGIEYIQEKYPNTNLFVVSDCRDSLDNWKNLFPHDKYLICWDKEVASDFDDSFIKEWDKIVFYKEAS